MNTIERDASQSLKSSNLKQKHNLNEVDEVLFSRPVGQCEESFRWQRISNHAQAQTGGSDSDFIVIIL